MAIGLESIDAAALQELIRQELDRRGIGINGPGGVFSQFLQIPTAAMVSQARAMGTAYQPSTSRPVFVIVSFLIGNTGNDYAAVLMDAANPPTTEVGAAQGQSGNFTGTVAFLVPPAFFYKFSVVAGAPTIRHTYELTL